MGGGIIGLQIWGNLPVTAEKYQVRFLQCKVRCPARQTWPNADAEANNGSDWAGESEWVVVIIVDIEVVGEADVE